jgi:CheY-like chemotaxis protein
MKQTEGSPNQAGKADPKPTPCAENRILIVDDEQSIRDLFSRIIALHLPHCRVDVAVDGGEAVSCFREIHHAVIVMDVRMPVMDGEAAYGAIRDACGEENWAMPAVIFCTGFEPSHEIKNIVAANSAHCVLRKPLDAKALMEAIRTRLGI